jgi:HD-like signal output (HDOD) protein
MKRKDQKRMITAKELVSNVTSLVSLPEIYLRVRDTINDPYSSIDKVSSIVSQDPNIASKILRISNSSFFGFASEITSINRAISIMGLSQLHDLVLAISVVRSFKGIPNNLINMKEFWMNSVFCAVISRLLAGKCNVLDSERLFVTGLLHDIGHLLMYIHLPYQMADILTAAKQQHSSIAEVEKQALGFDYANVGGELLKAWKMPESYNEAVAYHTDLNKADEFKLDASVIHIASIMVRKQESVNKGYGEPHFDPIAWRITELTPDVLESVKQEAKDNMLEVLRLLFGKSS